MISKMCMKSELVIKNQPNYALEKALEWNDQVKLSPIIFSLRLI
jgi:hypothetical protein